MARPRKRAAEVRSEWAGFRVTAAEKATFEVAAARAGLDLSEYLRAAAELRPVPAARPERQLRAEAITALLRIGVNLNQIARRVNMDTAGPLDMAELAQLIDAIDTRLAALER